MEVIVVVCVAFGLTVSEAKTEDMCLRTTKGVPEPTAVTFSVEKASQVYKNERVCIPRGERQLQCRPVHQGKPVHTQRIVQLPEVNPRTVQPT